eukprot:c18066_g1_i1.p1 GENE.c18066_g1_i1~~c18066_g1_i1.p1  ORF type:complete len:497 (-),score=149.20 c18066_g1_i1:216-1706(-)
MSEATTAQGEGRSLLQVYINKYCEIDETHEVNTSDGAGPGPTFEFVGRERAVQRQTSGKLTSIDVANTRITTVDGVSQNELTEFATMVPELRQLTLSYNSLDFAHNGGQLIDRLLQHLPNLVTLNAAHNTPANQSPNVASNDPSNASAATPTDETASPKPLKELIASATGLSWEAVVTLTKRLNLANLNYLSLCSSGVTATPVSPGSFEMIQTLHLDRNSVQHWKDIQSLGALPSLATLMLNENPLEDIGICEPGTFQQLSALCIADCKISEPACVDALNTYPLLTAVVLLRIPLFSRTNIHQNVQFTTEKHNRAFILARCGNITKLNRSEVSKKERIEAEQWAVRFLINTSNKFTASGTPAETTDASSSGTTPANSSLLWDQRCKELSEKWPGLATDDANANDQNKDALKSTLIELTFVPVAAAICHKSPETKNVPRDLPISTLKLVCSRLFGIAPILQKLMLSDETGGSSIELEDGSLLSAYTLADCKILIAQK